MIIRKQARTPSNDHRLELALMGLNRNSRSSQWSSPKLFLGILGVTDKDTSLVHLKDKWGHFVLHWAVREAARHVALYDEMLDIIFLNTASEWFDLATEVLRMGADPCMLSMTDGKTPLLGAFRHVLRERDASATALDDILQGWTNCLERAGVDLLECGQRESVHWQNRRAGVDARQDGGHKPHHTSSWDETLILKRLLHGARAQDWCLEVQRQRLVTVFALENPPGAWQPSSKIPRVIMWAPDTSEETEGIWKPTRTFNVVSAPFNVCTLNDTDDSFADVIEATQDDNGPIALMDLRNRAARCSKARSSSQPPITRRKEMAHWRHQWSPQHRWLPCFHLCPRDGRYGFCCCASGSHKSLSLIGGQYYSTFALRNCLRGIRKRGTVLHDSRHWQRNNNVDGTRTSLMRKV